MGFSRWLPLAGITVCVFIFNMSEFIPVGLLTGIGADFGTSESQTGMIISVYAWAVAILSLPMMLILKRMDYRSMLLLSVALFAVFQFVSGISTSYWMLMAARLGVAVSHAIFWSIAAPLAVRVVEKGLERTAISAVAAGTSIAMIVGLPVGRVIGLALGWRMTFNSIAVVAVVTLILLLIVFPRVENPGTFTVDRVPSIFKNRIILGIYVCLAIAVTGFYTSYSYIEPFLLGVAHLSSEEVTGTLILFGLAGILGSFLYNRLYGVHRFTFMKASFILSVVALAILHPAAHAVLPILAAIALWGMCQTMFNTSFQNEIIAVSPADAGHIVMALYSGIFNVGIATGSIMGGVVTDTVGVEWVGTVGAGFLLVSTLIVVFYLIGQLKKAGARWT